IAIDEELVIGFQLRHALLEGSAWLQNGSTPAVGAIFKIDVDRLQLAPRLDGVARSCFVDEAVAAEIFRIFPAAELDHSIILAALAHGIDKRSGRGGVAWR